MAIPPGYSYEALKPRSGPPAKVRKMYNVNRHCYFSVPVVMKFASCKVENFGKTSVSRGVKRRGRESVLNVTVISTVLNPV